MSTLILFYVIGGLAAVMAAAWLIQRSRRRSGTLRVRHFAFPSAWLGYLDRNVPLYRRLPMDLRDRLQDAVLEFVDGKRWRHCGGLEAVTDEMKVTIAGQACFLTLNRGHGRHFSKVLNVMIYPAAGTGVETGDENALPPEDAWPSSSVLLEWDAVKRAARDLRDNRNEVLHQFAQQLDLESGQLDGRPLLPDVCQHTAWARVMSRQFLKERAAAGGSLSASMTDGDPAEVFAAATEMFFQQPGELKRRLPEVYQLLCQFYKLDPQRWK